jgi:hypothetical protein
MNSENNQVKIARAMMLSGEAMKKMAKAIGASDEMIAMVIMPEVCRMWNEILNTHKDLDVA